MLASVLTCLGAGKVFKNKLCLSDGSLNVNPGYEQSKYRLLKGHSEQHQ